MAMNILIRDSLIPRQHQRVNLVTLVNSGNPSQLFTATKVGIALLGVEIVSSVFACLRLPLLLNHNEITSYSR